MPERADAQQDSNAPEFDFEKSLWPPQEEYPINNKEGGRKVGQTLEADLLSTQKCLIITGFTSLISLIEWFGTDKFSSLKEIRILLGYEPIVRKRKRYPFQFVDVELKEYWLDKRISIYRGSSIFYLIKRIEAGNIRIRYTKSAHAKIYISDNSAMLGSSNLSKNGMEIHLEANIRRRQGPEYGQISKLANNFYDQGSPYDDEIISLLKQLLEDVEWQDALARAISEVLEGDWFPLHDSFLDKLKEENFWPTQYSGMTEALNILIDKGSVLIADPTGSGKTKMCAAIIVAYQYWLAQIGESHRSYLLLFSPPLVAEKWREEFIKLRYSGYSNHSIGMLSHSSEIKGEKLTEELNIANTLAVDEAHNLLNPSSNRSKKISENNADHKILITATPVNKKIDDLLRIIELLDLDNLSDDDFDTFKEIYENRKVKRSILELQRLSGFIEQFLVRRTKAELNKKIDKEPDKYTNRLGNKCRFPKVKDTTYVTKETEKDCEVVAEINQICGSLKGLHYLKKMEPPTHIKEEDKESYVQQRISSAKYLSIYMIRSRLRSSKPALLEYLLGTDVVNEQFDLDTNKSDTGNMIQKIKDQSDELPEFKSVGNLLPDWLKSEESYQAACSEEIDKYLKIEKLVRSLSLERENGKARQIVNLLKKKNIVIGFDSTLITLDFLKKIIEEKYKGIDVLVASGSNKAYSEKVIHTCKIDTE